MFLHLADIFDALEKLEKSIVFKTKGGHSHTKSVTMFLFMTIF